MQFLERDGQLARLAELFGRAASGQGRCALVFGEAGAGKTSLLRRFAAVLDAKTPRLVASCEPLLSPRPLSPFVDLAEHWPPSLALALREGRQPPGLHSDLRAALSRRGVASVLIIDDLHWADAATLDAVRYLGRRLAESRLLMVLSFRDDDRVASQPLCHMLGELPAADTVRIEVPSLSAAAVAALAHSAGRSAEGLFEATGGNAFFVTETLADPSGAPAASVCDAVAARLVRLSPAARAAAEWAAVSPSPMPRALLERVSAIAPQAFDECCVTGMLRPCGTRLAFRHDLARRAVLRTLAPGHAAQLHRAWFELLQATPGVALQQLVHHAAHAGLPSQVLALAPRAAKMAAAMSAHQEAAALYRRALACDAVADDEVQAGVLEDAAVELRLVGAADEARAATEQALALRRRLGDRLRIGMNLRLIAAARSAEAGQRAAAEAAIGESIRLLQSLAPSSEWVLSLAEHSRMLCVWSNFGASISAGERAVVLAEQLPPSYEARKALVRALHAAACARLFVRDDPRALAGLQRALALALEIGAEDQVAHLYAMLQMVHLIYRRHGHALAVAQQGLVWCEARDLDAQRARLLENIALSLFETGRWGPAQEHIDRCLALPACSEMLGHSARLLLARLRSRRGDDDPALGAYWQVLSRAPLAQPLGYRLPAILAACVEAAWLRGENEQARVLARQGTSAAIDRGDARLAGPLLVWLHRLGLPQPAHSLRIASEHALELAGRHADAAAAWHAHGCGYEAALAALHGDAADVQQALQALLTLGAAPAADIARSRLRAMGVRGVPRGPQPRTRQDPEGLTPRQRQIRALLEQGLSNAGIAARLHRSERTVECHVAQVLAKLGVQSRGQVAPSRAAA